METEILRFSDRLTQSNCYCIVKEKKAVLIDPGMFDICERIQERELEVEWIFLTHEHCDHMAGLNSLRRGFPNARVLATGTCSRNLADKRKNMSALMNMYLFFRNGAEPEEKYPVILCKEADEKFDDRMELIWIDSIFSFWALPGHTEGSCGILMDGKLFFSGDYLILGEEVLTRFPGGSEKQYEEITKPKLEKLSAGKHIYPGHGEDYFKEGKMRE